VASGSSNGSGSYPEYTAFDGVVTNSTTGWASDATYASGTGISTFSWNGSFGEYLSLELPKALRLQKMFLKGYEHSGLDYQNAPRDIKLYGSNNETNWVLLKTETDLPIDSITNNSTYININATEHYKYIRLQITKTYRRIAAYTRIGELEYYGHEEGSGSLDTTLKTVYNVPATTGTQLEVYYDAKGLVTMPSTVTDLAGGDQNGAVTGATLDETGGIESFNFDGNDYISTTVTGFTGTSVTMSTWININSIDLSRANTIMSLGNWGTDGLASWIAVGTGGILEVGNYGVGNATSSVIPVTKHWIHVTGVVSSGDFRLYQNGVLISSGNGTGTINHGTNPILYLGTRADSSGLPESTRYIDSKIANTRLYSKALNADQVKELYDYQKDYFLGSKSQVTLYKGHLGVGVTEPSGQLELAGDERIQSIPPRGLERTPREVHDGMTADEFVEGHGVFNVSASGGQLPDYNGAQLVFRRHSPFTAVAGDLNYWSRAGVYNSSGTYTGTVKTSMKDGGTLNGEWIQLSSPYGYYFKKTVLYHRYHSSGNDWPRGRMPKDFTFVGSNNGSSWSVIKSFGNISYEAVTGKQLEIDSKNVYKDVRLIVHSIVAVNPDGVSGNETTLDIGQWRLFGTPGPTTLDKGSLSLTRSLNVPRVSRYDVHTETPRPEKLVLDFDTTVNSSPTDISGKGNHGIYHGTATYSAADKAFSFDGNSDWIQTTATGTSGNFIHSVSMWVKSEVPSTSTTSRTAFHMGNAGVANQEMQIQFNYNSAGTVYLGTQNGWLTMSNMEDIIKQNQWHHIAYTYNGTNMLPTNTKFYIDGKQMTMGNGSSSTLSFPSSTEDVFLGRFNSSGSQNWWDGQISNPKIYSVALEPSEVRKLYNLGRTGRSMVISDTAVGIGKVPEAQLDVRGAVRFDRFTDKLRIDHPGHQLSIGRSDAYANEFRWYAWGSGCNWYTPYTGKSIYIGRDGEAISDFDFFNVNTVKKGGSAIHSSDDRLKRDETFITNATDTLLKLKPQTYIKKHRLPENENDTDISEQFEAGLIAQDVWYDAPELRFLVHPSKDANPSETKPISPDPNDPTQDPDYSSWGTTQAYVNYEGFLPYLIKSNQEIYNELQAEKAKNLSKRQEHLVNENISMKGKITRLERKTTDQELELIQLKRRLNKLERPT